ncbi:MAG TPA: TraR/DksA C4-type zinc finger protein [Gaiellaceae bacterium]|jgi:DnaK suppressor protein|nr:TraR/DksA C4-type zinc finger protein [Gaiellaceae bacterium]
MTPAEVAEFRTALEEERARLEMSLATLHEDGQRTMEDEVGLPGGVGADTASATFERELGVGLEEGAQQTLSQIVRALGRLDDGTYGTCERCGNAIAHERLLARPAATLCIEDQRRADRG